MIDTFERITLDRTEEHEVTAEPNDTLRLHEYEGMWLLLEDGNGNTILRVYNLSHQQLAALYSEIGHNRLGVIRDNGASPQIAAALGRDSVQRVVTVS